MTICEQYYCAVYLYIISSVAISLLKLSLFLYIMSAVSTDGDQSDYGFQRIVHGEGAGAVQTSETRSEEIQTGQMISSHWVAEINAAIVSDIQEGKKAYMETLASGGSKAQAEKASNAVAGGRVTTLYDKLCQDNILVSLQVMLPPAKNMHEVYQNEQKLARCICDISPHMYSLKVDIWTSMHEIGQVCAGYVWWPYDLCENVQSMCAQLNKVTLGTHQLQCEVISAGIFPLWKDNAVPEQLEATIGGNKLPQLTGAALKEYQAMSTKPHMDSMKAGVILCDSEACTKDMAALLWATEIEQLTTSASFMISTQLQSPNEMDIARAYFQIAGILIDAASQGMNGESLVKCYGVKTPLVFQGGHQSLFLDHTVGCTYMTLGQPFPLQMSEFVVGGPGGTKIIWDAAGGILVVWCCKYALGGTNGIEFMQAGLMFLQLLTDQQHYTSLWSAAASMRDKIADFGAKVATAGLEPSSSSTPHEGLPLALQPSLWA